MDEIQLISHVWFAELIFWKENAIPWLKGVVSPFLGIYFLFGIYHFAHQENKSKFIPKPSNLQTKWNLNLFETKFSTAEDC